MSNYAMQSYRATAVHTVVEDAGPHQLILMLYDGTLRQMRLAKTHMVNGDLGAKAKAVGKAIELIDQGLRLSLDEERGGDIARNLHALYDYCEQRLIHANARNEPAILDEVIGLIDGLRSAWQGIADQARAVNNAR
jgi:flagellar secretion chaperone FliS